MLNLTGDGTCDTQPVDEAMTQRGATSHHCASKNVRIRKTRIAVQMSAPADVWIEGYGKCLAPTPPSGDPDKAHQTTG